MSHDPTIQQIESQCDSNLQHQADEYWDIEQTVEDEERFDEACGAWH